MAAPPDATASTKRARGRPHSKGNTVVGGFAPATKLKLLEKDIHGAGLTLLSAKPEGPRYSILSLLLMATRELYEVIATPSTCHLLPKSHCKDAGIPSIFLSIDGGPTLTCAWLVPNEAYKSNGALRIGCGRDDYVAIDAIRNGRQRATLEILVKDSKSRRGKLAATIPFTLESMDGLPRPVSLSACVDAAYWEGNPNPGDFPQWALAMELVGFERLYVPNQPYYYHQYAETVRAKPKLVRYGFDMVHRYTVGEQFQAAKPTTFLEIVQNLNVQVGSCMHEHWYDDWVFLSASTDEYFSLYHDDPSMLPKPPTRPTRLVQEYLRRFVSHRTKPGRHDWMPLDPLGRRVKCRVGACFPTRWFSEKPGPNKTDGESFDYEDPSIDPARRKHTRVKLTDLNMSNIRGSTLSFEKRTYRTKKAFHTHGAARKCAYHPDWRSSGPRTKIHGFIVDGCPQDGWLRKSGVCDEGELPEFRPVCWELCARWGNTTRVNFTDATRIDRMPPSATYPNKGMINNSCVNDDERYETWSAIFYRGESSLYPACSQSSPESCTGAMMERAHMRRCARGAGGCAGADDVIHAPWLSGMGPTVKEGLAAILGNDKRVA